MRLGRFLSRELAPFPGRFRAALRILVGCLAALLFTAIFGADLAPHGHWTITTIFTVSQADAGASLRKSLQRLLGTLAGGLLGILAVILFADLPMFYTPFLGAIVAFGLFASATTTASYVMLLGTITFVLVTFFPPDAAGSALETGLWRILAITVGVVCGAGAQLFLWPDDPEEKLRATLATRLNAIAAVLRALATRLEGHAAALPSAPRPRLAADDLTVQIDLLTNAEARHASLRPRHTEQLTLIVEADRLLATTVWLVNAAPDWGPAPHPAAAREIGGLAIECSQIAEALAAGRPPASTPTASLEDPLDGPTIPGLRPALEDIRLALRRARAALGFLDPARPVTSDLDRPARRALLTPGFSAKNTDAIALGLKAALGVEICYVLMHAVHWNALLTAAITAVLISQGSLGASAQKSMLRLAGAILGGGFGMLVIVTAMPNIQSLASLLAVAALGFGGAAWITAGSSRISYMGLQAGMAFAMCVTDPTGPTTNLMPGRDRVLGILVGVLVMMLVNATLWPVRARLAMRPALAKALHAIAGLARITLELADYRARLDRAVRLRSTVYGNLAATLRLSDESTLEPDAETPEAQQERQQMAYLTAHAQAVFLALIALIRHRLAPGFPGLPAAAEESMRALDADVGDTIDGLADRVAAGRPRPLPDLAARLAELEARVDAAEPGAAAGGPAVAAQVAERDHAAIARDLVHQVTTLRDAIGA